MEKIKPNLNEVWKDIKGYEGRYQVSNMGRVKSLERTFIDKIGRKQHINERILKLFTRPDGYLQVNFHNSKGELKRIYIHRLVCEAFHSNPKNKSQVNHINEVKTDNRACNLEWVTAKENSNHGTRNARISKAVTKALCKLVGQYTRDGKLIKVWKSTKEVERQLGFDHSNIGKVARGKAKIAYGYVWKYIEEGK